MKHLKTLIALFLLVIGTGTSWADVTICTWDFANTSTAAGTARYEGTAGTIASDVEGVELDVDATSGKLAPNGNSAQINTGTIIKVPVNTNKDEITITNFADPNGFGYTIGIESVDKTVGSFTYVATDADVTAGYATIDVTADGYIVKIVLKQNEVASGSVAARTVKWDWNNNVPSTMKDVNIQNTTGDVASNVNGVFLAVNATGGKLWGRGASGNGDDAQFYNATINVPVRHQGDVITVVSFPNYHNYTIAGNPATQDTETYTATEDDASAGYVSIIASGEAYLYSITVNQVAYSEGMDPIENVMSLITAIGYVQYTEECHKKIVDARTAYDALSEEQKQKVDNYHQLKAAEQSYSTLTPTIVDGRTVVWDWAGANSTDQILAESVIGTYSTAYIHSNVSGVSLEVNTAEEATVIDGSGAIYVLTLPKNCKIKVPVRRTDDMVTVVCGQDRYSYTIGSDETPSNSTQMTYYATQADADKGYVEIKTTGNTCLFSLTVKQEGFSSILPLITLNAQGWASFTSLVKGYVVTCPVGAQAYVATGVDKGDGEYGSVTLTPVDKFGYGEGVFIKGDKNTQIFANIIADKNVKSDVPDVANNCTIGCVSDVPLFVQSDAYVVATYKMKTSNEKAGFYRVNTSLTVPAGKAFLYAKKAAGAKYLNIIFADDEATGIESVLTGAETKSPTVFYNLAGQVVGKDYKGIVIGNDGKKYVK